MSQRHDQLVGSRCLVAHPRVPWLAGEPVSCGCRDTLPCEIWGRIGTFLLPDSGMWPLACRARMTDIYRLSVACSNINSALAPTRQVA